jgi:hypothetical protein
MVRINPISVGAKFSTLILGLLLCFAMPAFANDPIIYSFSGPNVSLGTSEIYNSNGISIKALGFTNGGAALDLYAKDKGGDEVGLGIANFNDSDHEITAKDFIQFNLTNLWKANPTNVQLSIGSVQHGESWTIWGSNTKGKLGVEIQSGTTDSPSTFALSVLAERYKYISIQAGSGDVLVSTLSANVGVGAPEPTTLLILGSSLAIIAIRKKMAKE